MKNTRLTTTPLPVHLKRHRVCRHHAHMCFNMCAWCRYTRGRFGRTHGGVLGSTRGKFSAGVTKYVVERKFQRPSKTVASCRIADGRHTQVSCATTNISSDRAIIGGKLVRWVRHFSSSRCTREQQDSHQDRTGRELTMSLQSHLPVVWYRKLASFPNRGRIRRASRSRPRAVDINYARTAENVTGSGRLVAETH